jgi:glycerol-3-phosphate dehydrogenase (NAD(P)+)
MLDQPSAHMPSVAVIGSGSWATAIVKILSERPIKVNWWMRSETSVEHIKTFAHNPKYLSDVQIDSNKVFPNNNIQECIAQSKYVILALPAAFIHDALKEIKKPEWKGKKLFSAIKGMIPDKHLIISSYLKEVHSINEKNLGVIAGPCHSEEVALERQSYLTISSSDPKHAEKLAHLLNCRYIHTHVIKDVKGVEYAAVMKNIISLAVGITRGMNYGDNFQAVLVANAMQEIKSFLNAEAPMGKRDLNESAYLGDLLVTAYSQFSRNRIFGQMIGKGYTIKSAQLEMNMIAEGYFAVKSLMEINKKHRLDLPICEFVYNILYANQSPTREIRILEARLR